VDINLVVDETSLDNRLDSYLSENTPLSRSTIQKLIKDSKVFVNNTIVSKSSYKTKLNDIVSFNYEENTEDLSLKPKEMNLDIVYEDEDLIVINKPKNLVVHPAVGNYDNTLVNGLIYYSNKLSDINGYYRPGIVHRIDKNTSGLLVVAKNNDAHFKLAEQLKDKTCFRKYYAIVDGVIDVNEGEINAPIGRNEKNRQLMTVTDKNSKDAITLFKVLERYSDSTFIECELKTGRTHQIRVHMKFIKHPVTNDVKYGGKKVDDSEQYLHAYYLSFIHPRTNERMTFKTKMPTYMREYIVSKGSKYEESNI